MVFATILKTAVGRLEIPLRQGLLRNHRNRLKLKFLKFNYCLLALFGLLTPMAHAVHLDVEVWGDGNQMNAGFCRTPGAVGCDLSNLIAQLGLPAGKVPIDGETRLQIFPTDFRDLTGGPYATNNPGFQAIQSALNPNEILRYKGLGRLMFWDPNLRLWTIGQTGRIRLFGGLNPESIITNPAQCGGALICFREGEGAQEGSTLFTADGIQGAPELVIDVANAKGALHTHLHLFLENQQGVSGGQVGAYMIEMQVLSNQRAIPSKPFFVIFNAGLSLPDFSQALLDRINAEPAQLPPESPELSFRADAGHDRLVRINSYISLDGSGSLYEPYSPSVQWRQVSGPSTVTIQNANSLLPSLSLPVTGEYVFELKLSHGSMESYDRVSFKVPPLGDVDGDGNIDREDVALILKASQSDETHIQNGDLRDLNGDGSITASDALLAKSLCTLNQCIPPIGNQVTASNSQGIISIPALASVTTANHANAMLLNYFYAATLKNQFSYTSLLQNPFKGLFGLPSMGMNSNFLWLMNFNKAGYFGSTGFGYGFNPSGYWMMNLNQTAYPNYSNIMWNNFWRLGK